MTTPTWFDRLFCRLFGHEFPREFHYRPPAKLQCLRCGEAWQLKRSWWERR